VAEKLVSQKIKILATNLKNKFGEIDILARDKKTIVIVEVKAKTDLKYGQPQEMVDFFKQKKLRQLARWLEQKYPGCKIRIDVAAVDMTVHQPKIKYFENAVIG